MAFTFLLILGAAGMVSLFWFRAGRAIPAWLNVSRVAMSLVVIGLVFWTANLGGQVRHSEIRPGAPDPLGNAGEQHE
ncbi:MAG TPA: hypothetical protein VN673_05230 [Clostridia bacterium]|nr:hypothetical protein [Clostridia bacterium]